MHMADALISPVTGITMLAASVGIAAYSAVQLKKEMDEKKIPLMGVMGAFIFAAQMINFSIPGTGSSGHLGGGLLLAILLGPYAGFLCMAAVLLIQAFIFADGGLLAYGCNLFNLAFFPCFIAYPFLFKAVIKNKQTPLRIMTASLVGGIIGLQLGAFAVVIETVLSARAALPFSAFVLLMQPIHLVIGAIEGLITGAIVSFVWKARPELLQNTLAGQPLGRTRIKNIMAVIGIVTVLAGGILSWFASSAPDGLEWSLEKIAKKNTSASNSEVHGTLSSAQEKTAVLPDYNFKPAANNAKAGEQSASSWPKPDAGTSFSGLIGGSIVFGLASLIGLTIWLVKRKKKADNAFSES